MVPFSKLSLFFSFYFWRAPTLLLHLHQAFPTHSHIFHKVHTKFKCWISLNYYQMEIVNFSSVLDIQPSKDWDIIFQQTAFPSLISQFHSEHFLKTRVLQALPPLLLPLIIILHHLFFSPNHSNLYSFSEVPTLYATISMLHAFNWILLIVHWNLIILIDISIKFAYLHRSQRLYQKAQLEENILKVSDRFCTLLKRSKWFDFEYWFLTRISQGRLESQILLQTLFR